MSVIIGMDKRSATIEVVHKTRPGCSRSAASGTGKAGCADKGCHERATFTR